MTVLAEAPVKTSRFLIRADLFDRLTDRIAPEAADDRDLAVRIMDQTLAFLAASAADPDTRLVPSRLVDIGWHTFLLYTRDYTDFCHQIAGRYIHHVPTDPTGKALDATAARTRTLAAITAAGYIVDADLWPPTVEGRHDECADEGNCSASGKDGNENEGTRIPSRG
ncbi:conserved hypothetical protein [Frankia sp. AiPs1]|uniref:glycine-rich domain-containing protein n=1 Tax=Frankia sp. AiPa1 TaxID=573492 RepID=UPI00202B8039|nr:hypothetical protein [Frankia sp. AiPa1]MCL9761468.1 hypothetical protein [Frankia sp. AiPa1]